MQLVEARSRLSFKIPGAIKRLYIVDDLGKTPAMCLRQTQTVFITPEFLKLPKDYQKYIIAHEGGHIAENTSNEFFADDFAVDWCIGQKMSLKNTLFAMTKVLSFPDDKPEQKNEQIQRCERQFKRIFDYDANINKNPKAMLQKNDTISQELDAFGERHRRIKDEKRHHKWDIQEQRQDRKDERTGSFADSRTERADAKHLKEEGKADLASQGISSDPLDKIKEVAGKFMDKSGAPDPSEGKILGMKKPLFFGVVAAVLILGGIAVWYFKFRKVAS